jgi:hypothetical protein
VNEKWVNDVGNAPKNESQNEKLIRLLEEKLAHSNRQNKDKSKQIEVLTDQVRHLTKLLYGSKTEKSKYNFQMGKVHYLMMTRLLANLNTQKNKANRQFLILLFKKLNQKNEMIPYMMVLK